MMALIEERVFLDSNILVYANDAGEPEKQRRARRLIADAVRSGTGCVSSQVLSEFWVTVTQKFAKPLAHDLARHQLVLFSTFTVVSVDLSLVLEAVSLQQRHQLSYWDSLIVAAANSAHCATLLTEDLQHGFRVGELSVCNPFTG